MGSTFNENYKVVAAELIENFQRAFAEGQALLEAQNKENWRSKQ